MARVQMLEDILMQLPAYISIVKGQDHRLTLINPPALELIGHRDVLGKPAREAFPEVEGQGYFELLDKVYSTGEPVTLKSTPVTFLKNGQSIQLYLDVSYVPLQNRSGEIDGVISFSYDVTEAVFSQKKLEEANLRLKEAFEDLEVKVKFRNIDLERENIELKKKLGLAL